MLQGVQDMVVFGYAVRLKIERIFVFVVRESDKKVRRTL